MNLLPTLASTEVEAGCRKARAGQVATQIGDGSVQASKGPRGELHSTADMEEKTLPRKLGTGADHRTSHSHCPRSLQPPRSDSPTQDR